MVVKSGEEVEVEASVSWVGVRWRSNWCWCLMLVNCGTGSRACSIGRKLKRYVYERQLGDVLVGKCVFVAYGVQVLLEDIGPRCRGFDAVDDFDFV